MAQVVFDWVMAHMSLVLWVVWEFWSLIPESVVSSSSPLTLIRNILQYLKDKYGAE